MVTTCPSCGASLEQDAHVCHECFFVVDHEHWRHESGGLGADNRGGGKPLEDPPIGPIPVTGAGLGGGTFGDLGASGFRMFGAGRILRWGRRK
jgi:hypothetical protein